MGRWWSDGRGLRGGRGGAGRGPQEVFMTDRHLAIAMEYAPGGDLSEYVDACKRAGVP